MPPNRSELTLALFAAWHLGTSATPVTPVTPTSPLRKSTTCHLLAGAVLTPATATGAGA